MGMKSSHFFFFNGSLEMFGKGCEQLRCTFVPKTPGVWLLFPMSPSQQPISGGVPEPLRRSHIEPAER